MKDCSLVILTERQLKNLLKKNQNAYKRKKVDEDLAKAYKNTPYPFRYANLKNYGIVKVPNLKRPHEEAKTDCPLMQIDMYTSQFKTKDQLLNDIKDNDRCTIDKDIPNDQLYVFIVSTYNRKLPLVSSDAEDLIIGIDRLGRLYNKIPFSNDMINEFKKWFLLILEFKDSDLVSAFNKYKSCFDDRLLEKEYWYKMDDISYFLDCVRQYRTYRTYKIIAQEDEKNDYSRLKEGHTFDEPYTSKEKKALEIAYRNMSKSPVIDNFPPKIKHYTPPKDDNPEDDDQKEVQLKLDI